MTQQVERPGDRFARPAHVVARSVSMVSSAGRGCRRAIDCANAWLDQILRGPIRALRWTGRMAARPFVLVWRLPIVGRAITAAAAFATIAFVVAFFAALDEPHPDAGAASASAAQNAFGAFCLVIAVMGAIKGLPAGLRAARWLNHVIEVASVELHEERSESQNDHTARELIPARLEVVAVDASASVGDRWSRFRAVREAARIVIESIPDGAWFAVLAASDGTATTLFPATGMPAIASPESRRAATVSLRLLWPSGEFDGGSALRGAFDLAALQDAGGARVTFLMAGHHPTTIKLHSALTRYAGHISCDVAVFGSGGAAANDIAARTGGRLVHPGERDDEAMRDLVSTQLSRLVPPAAASGSPHQ